YPPAVSKLSSFHLYCIIILANNTSAFHTFSLIWKIILKKELFLLKRNRIDRLIQLLDRLEKGEQCMSFKEFDLSDYISALEDFKSNRASEVIKHWGSIENFDMFIQKMKDDEDHVAKLAIQQFGSIEKYTEEMKKEDLFLKLASNREKAI